jgi:hypothetical protein
LGGKPVSEGAAGCRVSDRGVRLLGVMLAGPLLTGSVKRALRVSLLEFLDVLVPMCCAY